MESNLQDEARRKVEVLMPIMNEMSEGELRAEVGGLAMGERALDPETDASLSAMSSAADNILRRVRGIVCDPENRKSIGDTLTIANVSSIVALLAAVLNMGALPIGLIALAVLILRMGLNQYCRNY